MDEQQRDEQVEKAAEHAERSVEHREEERRLEGVAQDAARERPASLRRAAHEHHEAADREEQEADAAVASTPET
jgi:hypothetical protein